MADLSDLMYEEEASMVIKDASGRPMSGPDGEMRVFFHGPDTKKAREAFRDYRQSLIKLGDDADIDESVKATSQFLGRCVSRFENTVFEGDEVAAKDAADLFAKVSILRVQADKFLSNTGNFTKPGATN